jgi:hypothetical protein
VVVQRSNIIMVALNHNAPPVVKRAGFVDDIGPLQMTAITNDCSVILPFSEIARVLTRLDHIAHFIVNANHSIM